MDWTINATGPSNSLWKIDANFTSTTYNLDNETNGAYVCIGSNCVSVSTRQFSLTVFNSSLQQESGVSIIILNATNESQIISSGNGNISTNLNFNENYMIVITKNVSIYNMTVKIIKINITDNMNITAQIVESYSGTQPSTAILATSVFALNDTGLSYENVTLYIPNNGKNINKILHCMNWDFTTSSCINAANWTVNATSDYNMKQNSTHFYFNVSSFDGYGGGSVYLEVALLTPPPSYNINQINHLPLMPQFIAKVVNVGMSMEQ